MPDQPWRQKDAWVDLFLPGNGRFLFDLFTNKVINGRSTPILIACNKSEMVTAKQKEFIQTELEEELYVVVL